MLKKDDVRSLRVVKLAKNLTGRAVACKTQTRRVSKGDEGQEIITRYYAGRVRDVDEQGIACVEVVAVLSDDGESWIGLSKSTEYRAKADALIPLNESRKGKRRGLK